MKKSLVIVSLILGITAVNAQQAATQEKSGLKPYVGVEVGSSGVNSTSSNKSHSSSLGTAFGVNAGLMFNQYFGAEVFYNDLGSKRNFSGTPVTVSVNVYGVLAKGQYTFNASAVSIYGKLGFGNINAKFSAAGLGSDTETDSSTILDLGLGYQFMPQLQGTVGYSSYIDNDVSNNNATNSFSMFGLGLNYSF